jgi:hypothetical protein
MGSGTATLLADAAGAQSSNEFFAMDTAVVKTLGTPLVRSDVETLAALGYRGVAPIVSDQAAWAYLTGTLVPLLDKSKLKLDSVYTSVSADRAATGVDTAIKQHLSALKGRGTIVWLPVTSKDFRLSDPAGDRMAVAEMREVADAAAHSGLSVSLYPRFGKLIERAEDAVRIAGKTGRANVGVTFNPCYWLRTSGPDCLADVLRLATPRLSLVTINGADRNGKDWSDFGEFARRVEAPGTLRPIGYNVANHLRIEPAENLRRSMRAWRELGGMRTSFLMRNQSWNEETF